jgi:hypothetical protein
VPLPIDVVDVLPAFPGVDPRRPTVVVSHRLLDPLVIDDPRYQPVQAPSAVALGRTWTTPVTWPTPTPVSPLSCGRPRPEELDRVLTQFGVEPAATATLAQAELEPALAAARRGLGYQRSLGCAWRRWRRWRCACTPTGRQRAGAPRTCCCAGSGSAAPAPGRPGSSSWR